MNRLVDWVVEGLDFELSLNQPQTAYKVRHLKAGIRLATLLFETNKEIILKLLDKDVPKLLIQLFEQPYMVLPVKLLILRAVDSVISTQPGLNYIAQKTVKFFPPKVFDINDNKSSDEKVVETTCYQKLLGFIVSKQLTRAVVSISALLNKIHLNEVLMELSDSVEKVIQCTQLPETKSAPSDSPELSEQRAPSAEPEAEPMEPIPNPGENLVEIIASCIQEITFSYKTALKNVSQSKRFLPARSLFEFSKSSYSPYPSLLRLFKENKLLENIFVLLSSPALSSYPVTLSVVRDLLLELISSQEGMLFMLSLTNVTNGIQRVLLHTEDEAREEGSDENIAQNLGMQIVYHLQALLYVDCLMTYQKKEGEKKELDNSEPVSALHHMYTMVFVLIGRLAVVNILTSAENLNALLPFVQMSGDENTIVKQSKSVCAGYVTELLMLVVHYSDNVNFLEKFSDSLYNLSQQEKTPKLHDLAFWMAPTRSIPNYTFEAVPALMAIVKAHNEDAASLPPELITSLRILQHLTLQQDLIQETGGKDKIELKYMYATIQVFYHDGMENMKNILQVICDTFLKPSHQSHALVGLQGVLVVAIIKPAVFMLKAMLAYLIAARGTEFKDLTAVP